MSVLADWYASNGHRLGLVESGSEGTPASAWLGGRRWVPELDLTDVSDVLVVAPHPDDEVLGAAGLMARSVSRGATVTVAGVTDGDAAWPPFGWSRERLASERVAEAALACAVVGVREPVRLGLPDGRVARHHARLVDRLTDLLSPTSVCVATWRLDGHPDHEAVGRAAAAACQKVGATLLEYPVWTWHWSHPDDPTVPWSRLVALPLTTSEQHLKRAAVACHRTQVESPRPDGGGDAVLPPFAVRRLTTDREVFFTS